MPRPTSLDRGYLDLPSAYYPSSPSPRSLTFGASTSTDASSSPFSTSNNNTSNTTSSHVQSSNTSNFDHNAKHIHNNQQQSGNSAKSVDGPESPIAKAFKRLHERRKSRAEVEEEIWFGGLVNEEEERRKRKELVWGSVALLGVVGLGGVWWILG